MAESIHAPSPSPAPSPLADIHKVHGRDSPAGKLLHKLYGGDSGKKAGLNYSQVNRERHQARVESGWTPPKPLQPAETPKPSVCYPKFGNSRQSGGLSDAAFAAPVDQIPHRRRGDVIQLAISEEAEHQRQVGPPLPRGPLLGEAEKQKCAEAMRFRGKIPEITPEQRAAQVSSKEDCGHRTRIIHTIV